MALGFTLTVAFTSLSCICLFLSQYFSGDHSLPGGGGWAPLTDSRPAPGGGCGLKMCSRRMCGMKAGRMDGAGWGSRSARETEAGGYQVL